MQILCPYCHSEHVQRMLHTSPQQSNNQSNLLGSSATFASIGATLSKSVSKQLSISPWVGGIAGIMIGGVLSSLFDSPKTSTQAPVSYFYCQACKQSFQ
ncbi:MULTISPECIES: hypothetical protein [Acinetobacter]|uniref:hypothetical protein n=1 Tax=Acinetobacter TaxID=469 RepID=UPI00141BD81B|nr:MULTISPECIES: hypothetical protein [Acinetobacter]MCS4298903.1 hypothetical protein [Acinetobacter guillouiae]MCW2252359.1 hypothetical protein [Acinetobacter sp. BIGb0204]NII38054.1 hypothetical protein [Acinetobacter sp. BIGb0196]